MTKMSASSPWLLNDEGTRFVGIVHPDGTESEFVFAQQTKETKPAPKQADHPGGAHGKSEVH